MNSSININSQGLSFASHCFNIITKVNLEHWKQVMKHFFIYVILKWNTNPKCGYLGWGSSPEVQTISKGWETYGGSFQVKRPFSYITLQDRCYRTSYWLANYYIPTEVKTTSSKDEYNVLDMTLLQCDCSHSHSNDAVIDRKQYSWSQHAPYTFDLAPCDFLFLCV